MTFFECLSHWVNCITDVQLCTMLCHSLDISWSCTTSHQSIRLWATGLLYGNRFSHCEVELWAVTDEASKVHKNTQVRILINGPRVGLSCTIQWKKCICTLLLPFFKLAKTKKSTWVAVLFYFLTGRSTGTIIQQQPPHLMSIICLFFPLLENIKAALWCYEMYWMPMK